MDIRPLCGRLGLEVCEAECQKRMWQTGLAQVMRKPPLAGSIPQIIRTVLIEPVVKELCRKTGKDVRYQHYGLEGYFRLLLRGKPFAVISLPNPGNGRVFVKFLDACGRQCSPMKELHNTDVLVSFLRETAG